MNYGILDSINSISDLKALNDADADKLCDEIRAFLIEKVEMSGGHLASNLGVVELSVALHRVFDSPEDHIIFDVGHQAYVHKLLTGRRRDFDKLRIPGGLSGFTSRRESEHDPFGAGHSSTSLSAALGFAESDKLRGSGAYSVAVIGDGAYTGGMIHEAINNCKPDLNLIAVLNENGMSISSNKGVFASYLSGVRASKRYINAKKGARNLLDKIPILGKAATWCASTAKNLLKRVFYETNYFEELGFYYIGPIDGNDRRKVERALRKAKSLESCVFVHINTTKGKGMQEAETAPEKFHSVAKRSSQNTFHSVFAETLVELAKEKKDIAAVTAAMGIGTGLSAFELEFPERYYDVGIAEAHALTFSAGLAANGIKPYAAIYSTFLQRGYDSIVHDIALQNLPVKMFIDRAGLAVSDGATHHGIFDVSFLSHIPGVEIIAPASYDSLKKAVEYAYGTEHPIAVRYPNAEESEAIKAHFEKHPASEAFGARCDFDLENIPKNIFVTYGQIAEKVIVAERILASRGIECGAVLLERIRPCDDTVAILKPLVEAGAHIVYVEEGIKNGGAAMLTREALIDSGAEFDPSAFDIAAIDGNFASPTEICDLYDYVGLSPEKLAEYFA